MRRLAWIAAAVCAVGACDAAKPETPPPAARAAVIDPICGMEVTLTDMYVAEHEGRRYSFCMPGCNEEFERDPARYAMGYSPCDEAAMAGCDCAYCRDVAAGKPPSAPCVCPGGPKH